MCQLSPRAPRWRFRVGGLQKMGFFGTSQCDLIPSQGSNERPLSRIRPLASNTALRQLSPRAPTCDPCRGFGSSDPVRFSTGFRCSHDGHNAPQDAPKTPPGRPKPTPVPRAATMPQDVLETPPQDAPTCSSISSNTPCFCSAFHPIVIAAVVRAPCICGLLTTLGGRAGYGKNRKRLRM